MAPLKLDFNRCSKSNGHFLPCLKRHGSIEAAYKMEATEATRVTLPCLKRHGSIEAVCDIATRPRVPPLTMSEKTWLH